MNKKIALRKLVFSLAVLVLVFSAAEIGLRIVGFRFQRSLSYMRFAFPNPNELHNVFIEDPLLLWRMRPHYQFGHGIPKLNKQGFRSADFHLEKPANTFRVACLGDSVTFGNYTVDYPSLLQEELSEKTTDLRVEVMNFGVPGYSLWQGKRQLESVVLPYQPGLVTVLFGWNDHWLARGYSDHEQKLEDQDKNVKSSSLLFIKDVLGRIRVYQAINFMVSRVQVIGSRESSESDQRKLRVPPENFRENYFSMIDICAGRGIPVVLITAPDAIGVKPTHDFLYELEFIRPEDDLEALHTSYTEVVREVAREKSVSLVDAQLLFDKIGARELFSGPESDVIHPNVKGMRIIAHALAEDISTLSVLESHQD